MDPKQLKAFIQSAYKLSPNQAARAFAKEREASSRDLKKGPVPEVRTREPKEKAYVQEARALSPEQARAAFLKERGEAPTKAHVKPARGSLETGEKGGKFYRTEYGTKIYVKD